MNMNQKGFANIILIVVIVAIAGMVGYFAFVMKSEPVVQQLTPTFSSFEARKENEKMVLYKIYSDGTSRKTGLEITLVKAGTSEEPVKIVVSPNKTKAVFGKWNNTILKTEIYVSNIDGSNVKLLTQQEVGEGGGELNQNSLAWSSDGKYITYYESVITCEGGCDPNQSSSEERYYQVNIATGEKEIVSITTNDSNATATTGHILAFEQAVNKSDFSNASKYFADKVDVLLEGSSCCGEIPASQAKMYFENEIKGLLFTFNPNDAVVKEYITSMTYDYPNRRLIKDSPKLYFDELSIGVESDVSQQNKASIGYKVSNDKITVLFINKGRDR